MKLVDRMAERLAPRGQRGESIAEASRIGEISRASNILLFAIAGANNLIAFGRKLHFVHVE